MSATVHKVARDRVREMEKRLLLLQTREPSDQVRKEYRSLHRRWVSAKDQLTLRVD